MHTPGCLVYIKDKDMLVYLCPACKRKAAWGGIAGDENAFILRPQRSSIMFGRRTRNIEAPIPLSQLTAGFAPPCSCGKRDDSTLPDVYYTSVEKVTAHVLVTPGMRSAMPVSEHAVSSLSITDVIEINLEKMQVDAKSKSSGITFKALPDRRPAVYFWAKGSEKDFVRDITYKFNAHRTTDYEGLCAAVSGNLVHKHIHLGPMLTPSGMVYKFHYSALFYALCFPSMKLPDLIVAMLRAESAQDLPTKEMADKIFTARDQFASCAELPDEEQAAHFLSILTGYKLEGCKELALALKDARTLSLSHLGSLCKFVPNAPSLTKLVKNRLTSGDIFNSTLNILFNSRPTAREEAEATMRFFASKFTSEEFSHFLMVMFDSANIYSLIQLITAARKSSTTWAALEETKLTPPDVNRGPVKNDPYIRSLCSEIAGIVKGIQI